MKRLFSSFSRRLLWFSMVMAAAILLICSKSSPLYPLNDWVDVNCFFTVGRGILDGVVPYRDLYEQKGPVLYFLFALASLVSRDSFLGVYLLETVCFGLFLWFAGRIAGLYLGQRRECYAIVVILGAALAVSPAFSHGTSCETLSLCFLGYSLLSVLQAIEAKRPLTFWEAFLNGLCAACVVFIKFTMAGFYMGLALFVILWYLCSRYSWKALLKTVGQFLLGVAAVTGLIALYFGPQGAIDDLYTVYFYNNLFLYPQEPQVSRLHTVMTCLWQTLDRNPSYCLLLLLAPMAPLLHMGKNRREGLLQLGMVLLSSAGLVLGTYWGGRGYVYYGLIIAVFAVFGLTAFFRALQLTPLRPWLTRALAGIPLVRELILALGAVAAVSFCLLNSPNTYLMEYEKQEHPAYQFAQTIRQAEDPQVLNFGFLDGGFYYAAGVTPTCKYFCTLNIAAPDMWQVQREYIADDDTDFVITRRYTLDRYTTASSSYKLVDTATFRFEGVNFTYYLYQRIP